MKKLSIVFFLVLLVSTLTACVEEGLNKVEQGKNNIKYVSVMSGSVITATDAYFTLSDLYKKPFLAGTEDWQQKFETEKERIEQVHQDATKVTAPAEMQGVHDNFISVLETTMNVNDTVTSTIESGEDLTGSVTGQFSESLENYQTISSTLTEYFKTQE